MPEISRFLGIVIRMYLEDHSPPHFHAVYGDFEITVEIKSGITRGKFPKRAMRHVLEWLIYTATSCWMPGKRLTCPIESSGSKVWSETNVHEP